MCYNTAHIIIIIIIILSLVINILCIKSTQSKKPNIVLILTDDEDQLLLGPTIAANDIMPNRNKIFVENGIQFKYGFASSPTCCVSRSSILTGKYVHNHQVTNNTVAGNCWSSQFRNKHEPFTYATYLNNIGYNTFHAGKYLNEYGRDSMFDVPIGWDWWYSLSGQILYYDYCISNMGKQECFGKDANDYISTMIKNKALNFLKTKSVSLNKPFLLVLSSIACHSPFSVEDEYKGIDDGNKAPRTLNWNIVGGEFHNKLLQMQIKMNDDIIKQSDEIYSWRLGTLRSIDDTIGEIYNFIDNELNELNNTFFLYTSDHGFHSGQWAMSFSKMQLYETDIRIPFYLSGPNIKKGANSKIFATTIDIAPTILDIAGIDYKKESINFDGKSLLKYGIEGGGDGDGDEDEEGDQVFLIDYNGMGMKYDEYMGIQSNIIGFNEVKKNDGWNNTYACLRWINFKKKQNYKYCKFKCFTKGKKETPCDINSIEAKGEMYNLNHDPWELTNIYSELNDQQHQILIQRLHEFKSCNGEQCRLLYSKPLNVLLNVNNPNELMKNQKFNLDSILLKAML